MSDLFVNQALYVGTYAGTQHCLVGYLEVGGRGPCTVGTDGVGHLGAY